MYRSMLSYTKYINTLWSCINTSSESTKEQEVWYVVPSIPSFLKLPSCFWCGVFLCVCGVLLFCCGFVFTVLLCAEFFGFVLNSYYYLFVLFLNSFKNCPGSPILNYMLFIKSNYLNTHVNRRKHMPLVFRGQRATTFAQTATTKNWQILQLCRRIGYRVKGKGC